MCCEERGAALLFAGACSRAHSTAEYWAGGGALLSLPRPPAHRAAAEPQLRASQELELCSMASQGRALGVALRAAEGAAGQLSQQGSALGSAPHSPAGLGAPTCTPLGAATLRAGAVPSSSSLWVL